MFLLLAACVGGGVGKLKYAMLHCGSRGIMCDPAVN